MNNIKYFFTNTGIHIEKDNRYYDIILRNFDAITLEFLLRNELIIFKQDIIKNDVIDKIKIKGFPNLFIEEKPYSRDLRSVIVRNQEKIFKKNF